MTRNIEFINAAGKPDMIGAEEVADIERSGRCTWQEYARYAHIPSLSRLADYCPPPLVDNQYFDTVGDRHNRQWTDAEDDTMIDLRSRGYSWQRVGLSMRRSENSCRNRWSRIVEDGMKIPSNIWTEGRLGEVKAMRVRGWTYAQIAREMRVSIHAAEHAVKKLRQMESIA